MGIIHYRHYIGDYDKATKALTLQQHGVYRRLMDYYVANKGPIPAEPAGLYRAVGAFEPAEQADVRMIAKQYFTLDAGMLHHERCDEELEWIRKHSKAQAEKAAKRWGAAPEPAPKPPADKPPKPAPKGDYGASFLAFWDVYPGANKGSKSDAWKAWQRQSLIGRAEELMLDVKARASRHFMWRKNGGQFIPQVSRYINGKLWEEEINERGASGKPDNEAHNESAARDWAGSNQGEHDD